MTVELASYIGDLNTAYPDGADTKSEGDNHLRLLKTTLKNTLPGLVGRAFRTHTESTGYTAVANDNTTAVRFAGAATLNLTAAATLGNGWLCLVIADGGDVTVDPNSTENINGAATFLVPNGQVALVFCTNVSSDEFYVLCGFSGGTLTSGITITAGNVVLTDGDLTLTAGDATLSSGVLVVTAPATNNTAITGNGAGNLHGVRGVGGATGNGVIGVGGASGNGVVGTGGGTTGFGVYGSAGVSGSAGVIGYAQNGSTYGMLGYANNYSLYGNGYCYAVDFTAYSDERAKRDIQTIYNPLDLVAQLRGVRFHWKASGKPSVGMVAQEVARVVPEVVHEGPDGFAIAYGPLVGVLVEAVKELTERVRQLEGR